MASGDHTERGPCRRRACRHAQERHRHFRGGTDCGTCGDEVCPSYLPPRGVLTTRLLRIVGR